MNFFHHKDLGNHLLQLCPKVVKHPVYYSGDQIKKNGEEEHVASMCKRKDTYKLSVGKPYVKETTWKTKLQKGQ